MPKDYDEKVCGHKSNEDCLICCLCGNCDESLDEDDICDNCRDEDGDEEYMAAIRHRDCLESGDFDYSMNY